MSLPENLGRLSSALTSDASLNIGVGVTPSGSFKLEVGTTSKFTGVATFGSTLSNGTYSYTLPSATGTLALVGGAGVGTVTSVAAITLGTTGTDLSSTVATGTTTPVITLNVPDASAANRGVVTTGVQTFAGAKTLTGALSGTSATFTTSDVNALNIAPITGTSQSRARITNTGGDIYFGVASSTGVSAITGTTAYSGYIATSDNSTDFFIGTGGAQRFKIASTGAATFSGNLSCSGATIQLNQTEIFPSSGASNRAYAFNLGNVAAGDFSISQGSSATGGTYTTRLIISPTGVATFSGGVVVNTSTSTIGTTADLGLLINNNGASGKLSQIGFGYSESTTGAVIGGIITAGGGATSSALFFATRSTTVGSDAPTERMRITSGGNVGIGTTDLTTVRLRVKSTTTGSSNFVLYTEDSAADALFWVRDDGLIDTGSRANSPYNYAATGRAMIVESNGYIGYLVSTRESKSNIESIKSVDFINKLNPVQFNYRKKDNITNAFIDEVYDNITYGFIADEVEKVDKNLVFYNEDGITLSGVEYNNMIALLVKSAQELNKKLELQQAQVKELKAEIDLLKGEPIIPTDNNLE